MSYSRSKSLPSISCNEVLQKESSDAAFSRSQDEKLKIRSSFHKKMKYFFNRWKKSKSGGDLKDMMYDGVEYRERIRSSHSYTFSNIPFKVHCTCLFFFLFNFLNSLYISNIYVNCATF